MCRGKCPTHCHAWSTRSRDATGGTATYSTLCVSFSTDCGITRGGNGGSVCSRAPCRTTVWRSVRHPRTCGCAHARELQGRTALGLPPRRERERERETERERERENERERDRRSRVGYHNMVAWRKNPGVARAATHRRVGAESLRSVTSTDRPKTTAYPGAHPKRRASKQASKRDRRERPYLFGSSEWFKRGCPLSCSFLILSRPVISQPGRLLQGDAFFLRFDCRPPRGQSLRCSSPGSSGRT